MLAIGLLDSRCQDWAEAYSCCNTSYASTTVIPWLVNIYCRIRSNLQDCNSGSPTCAVAIRCVIHVASSVGVSRCNGYCEQRDRGLEKHDQRAYINRGSSNYHEVYIPTHPYSPMIRRSSATSSLAMSLYEEGAGMLGASPREVIEAASLNGPEGL